MYNLKCYDEVLASFVIGIDGGIEERVTDISYINPKTRVLLPVDMELTPQGMTRWLHKRSIPKNRTFVNEIFSSLGLKAGDIKGMVDVCMCLSLNDSYWVVDDSSVKTFSEVNLYENPFSEALSLVAYTGYSTKISRLSISPELTTNGMLPKAWRRIDNEIVLYKGGDILGGVNNAKQPYSEFYASQIAKQMGLNHVYYGLDKWKDLLASTCKLFTNIDTSYVPSGLATRLGGIDATMSFYQSLGNSYYEELSSMFVFDALIYNTDRHFGNFGLLRDNKTGEYISPAPIFDNGNALLPQAYGGDWNNLDELIEKNYSISACGQPHDVLVENFCGKVQQEQLRKMINFKFTPHPKYNLPLERLEKLEEFLQRRTHHLLEMEKIRLKNVY